MREKLAPLLGRRRSFVATFARYGTAHGRFGHTTITLLLREVIHGGEVVTDHVWFKMCQAWQQLALVPHIGERVQFTATVSAYVKGYRGDRQDLEDVAPLATDYRLARPGNIVRVDAVDPLQFRLL